MSTCELCGGTMKFLGTLGNYDWYRCENCGIERFKERTSESPPMPDEDDE